MKMVAGAIQKPHSYLNVRRGPAFKSAVHTHTRAQISSHNLVNLPMHLGDYVGEYQRGAHKMNHSNVRAM